MANPEHLALLKQGMEAWNEWRAVNPDTKPDLGGADLRRAKLAMVNLRGASLGGADLRGASLGGADFSRADLREASFYRAYLRMADLHEADFRKADLRKAELSMTELQGADLRGADLYERNLIDGADLRWADLQGADLRETELIMADLMMADLRKADLREANLAEANLSWANLREANLSRVILKSTIFQNVNLAKVKGLGTCRHFGPSCLDFRTLQQSGSLPLVFLRGCGLPDLLIDYLPSLLNQPIQYYSCFISYSSKDKDFAQRLHADLQSKDVRCWFAPKDVRGGRKLHEQIGEAIQVYEKLLLVLSEHSMNSVWVKTEIAKARQCEMREKRKVLFPIRLVNYETIQQWECFDADMGKDSAMEIREYFIPDFSNWKSHDDYQQAFDRLLRDLKPALERKPETS